jgi:hypothetical protein
MVNIHKMPSLRLKNKQDEEHPEVDIESLQCNSSLHVIQEGCFATAVGGSGVADGVLFYW